MGHNNDLMMGTLFFRFLYESNWYTNAFFFHFKSKQDKMPILTKLGLPAPLLILYD